ncbi:hypothetical protein DPMN_093705 [Dreissena polymorpha]|uniref:Uncharacterized protein n=1 Tax=Dreissena polymorpha TaxID=45954 RepID=A0A9D4L418_DREPO|nr:hypothetical protein DPMN_093705 [Dreissena polymorpha]
MRKASQNDKGCTDDNSLTAYKVFTYDKSMHDEITTAAQKTRAAFITWVALMKMMRRAALNTKAALI